MPELNPNSTARNNALNAADKARQAAQKAREAGVDRASPKSKGHQLNTNNPGMGQIPQPQPSTGSTSNSPPKIQVNPLSTNQIDNLEKLAKENAERNARAMIRSSSRRRNF